MTSKHKQLRKLVYTGAKKKNLDPSDAVLDRISYELSVIEKLGFTDYFIVYARIVEICNDLNLIRSYGRSTAPNSIINYCLDITKINPLEENLIFERFIHPEQKQLPDIDIDIPQGQHKNVIEALKRKYPEYHLYFFAFMAQKEMNWEDVFYNNIHYKKHPFGIIITSEKLANSSFSYEGQEFYLPNDISNDLYYTNKIDILELRYLNRIQLIVNEIGQEFHPFKLPLNDLLVFNYFATENLDDIFQLNSTFLKKIFSQFKPNSIQDLSIVNAMYRPGVLKYFPTIIRNKFKAVKRFCPSDIRVSEILKETYGVMIYQETLLHLSKQIAGLSFAEAELWRKKMMRDKSNIESIAFSSVFTTGCRIHSTLNETDIVALTNLITEMIHVTFPKAHAMSYAIVGYWGAYYKMHFISQFKKAFSSDLKF